MRNFVPFLAAALLMMPTFVGANVQSEHMDSVLMDAAAGGQTALVKSLLDSGANVEAKNHLGATPLIFAAVEGHPDVVKLLLDRGANANARTSNGITPLMAAASAGDADIVKLLLDKRADVSAKDQQGRTALNIAEAGGDEQVIALLRLAAKSSVPTSAPVARSKRPADSEVILQPGVESFDGPVQSYSPPLAGIGAGGFPVIIPSRIQGGKSEQIETKPGGPQEQKPQPAPQQKPTTTETKNPDGTTTIVTTNPGGLRSEVTKDPTGAKVREMVESPKGTYETWKYDAKTGSLNQHGVERPNDTTWVTYSGANCSSATMGGPECSKTKVSQGNSATGVDTTTNYGPDGKKTSVKTYSRSKGTDTTYNYAPDGRLASIVTENLNKQGAERTTTVVCDAPGKCPMPIRALGKRKVEDPKVDAKKSQAGQAQALKDKAKLVDPKGGKKTLQAEVLGQIGGKPSGDLTGKTKDEKPIKRLGRSKTPGDRNMQAEVLGQIGGKAAVRDLKAGVNKSRSEAQMWGVPSGSGRGVKDKLLNDNSVQMKKNPGEAVGLNPQPLPPKTNVTTGKERLIRQMYQKGSTNPSEAGSLNPQPLPPKATAGQERLIREMHQRVYKNPGGAVGLNPQPLPPRR